MSSAPAGTAHNILIGGEAGQGIATLGELVVKNLVRGGYHVVVTQSYHSRIRGGHNTFAIHVSTEPIAAPQERVDLLVALNEETVTLHRDELGPGALAIVDEKIDVSDEMMLKVPFSDLAAARFANTAAFGIITALLGMDKALALSAVEKAFGKDEEVVAKNAEALDKGYQWGLANNPTGKPLLAPAVAPEAARLCMNGNEAIALGALSAGVKFAAFYPMTPSTSVMLNLIAHADAMGLVVEQAEDEIAAINMAIGGSFAGAPSMVATSGGGLALMTEGVSLAGMTETPVVIVVGQRPGPATGLPTRTEQADLQMVLHTGHGEFPRAVFAPGDIQECFHLTRQAFLLAEQCQSPIFLLTDQFLADSYRAVEPFDVGKLEPVRPPLDAAPFALPYQRFEITEDGISPRLLPGTSEHLVVADSDEHTPDGHITEDLEIRTRMVDKRLRKGARLQSAVVAPEYQGDESPEVLLLCWGSVKGSVQDATQRLRAAGTTAAMLHFSQVWPLAPEQFLARLQGAERAVCVEGNATGQFARLIRRETGFEVSEHVLRYDGLPITPEYVLAGLNSHVGQERG